MAVLIRRLLGPFVGLLLLSIALQAASFMALLEIEASVDRSRQQVSAAAEQFATVEHFENATYLAIVGLATSDWELLLRQQGAVQELARRFAALNEAISQGGQVRLGDMEVMLPRLKDPEIRAALATVPGQWDEMYQAHVRTLRSENYSLKKNPALERFRAASQRLRETLAHVSELIQRRSQAEMGRLSHVQRIIPVGAFLLTLGIFAFVFWWILLPFVASTEELARSELELRRARDELEHRVTERTWELAQANEALRHAHEDLEVRVKERTHELREAQRHAVELARQAGMAEMATNVLHNVGNVLNSVNTSSTLLSERLNSLRIEPLVKLTEMIEERRGDLAAFLSADERGRHLPSYLCQLGRHFSDERKSMLEMTAALRRHVEHIRMIVELQQNYATSSSFVEATSLEELIEDALRISAAALGRHGIMIERQIVSLPRLMLDKHKLLQIMLNLISNAKYAMNDRPPGQRRLAVRIDQPSEDFLRVRVTDNGMGIAPELLTKIFQHGFTTRKEGHGFGLHSCAIAAQALGGSLVAHSDGPGTGATFTLEFPYHPETSASTFRGS